MDTVFVIAGIISSVFFGLYACLVDFGTFHGNGWGFQSGAGVVTLVLILLLARCAWNYHRRRKFARRCANMCPDGAWDEATTFARFQSKVVCQAGCEFETVRYLWKHEMLDPVIRQDLTLDAVSRLSKKFAKALCVFLRQEHSTDPWIRDALKRPREEGVNAEGVELRPFGELHLNLWYRPGRVTECPRDRLLLLSFSACTTN
ncbi:hypothetical protein PSACC_01393 [Paramicrosporidium saccamoebae]|uniref:Uncharacterized protein n=1 Tax=Paramicrosporidium saccamoebae TaxID=1246581 RepID=A0A2H9TM46_9FUNG|nr:hypothetical protein PSACC_01393 [Paramicrosporidium saccamoebae]